MAQQYYDYSSLVIVMTLLAVGTAVYETRKVIDLVSVMFKNLMETYWPVYNFQQTVALRKRAQVTGSIKVIRGGVGMLQRKK